MGYFATEREGDELCGLGQRARDVEYEVFARYAEPGFEELDFELECARVSQAFGRSASWVEGGILAYHRLRDLPKLKAMQAESRRLDVTRLKAIGETVDKLRTLPQDEVLEEFDQFLVAMFTPKRDGEVLPSPMAIRRRLNDRLRKIDASLAPDPKKTKKRKEEQDRPFGSVDATFFGLNDYEASLCVNSDAATIGIMELYTNAVARERKITQGEAIKALLTGEATSSTTVVLNLFASKSDRSTYYLPNFGWTDAEGTAVVEELLRHNPTRTVDLDAASEATTGAYVPTAAMKAYVQARDGTCVYPGCDRPAIECQLDHRVPFDDGGPTTPSNLFCLCQRHHNLKTDRRAFYVPDPATGDIVWLFADGTYQIVQPEGLLAASTCPERPRWRQTIEQRREARAAAAVFHARCHAAVQAHEEGGDFIECITELHRLEKEYGMTFPYWPDLPLYMEVSESEWQYYLNEMRMIDEDRRGRDSTESRTESRTGGRAEALIPF